MSDLPRILAGAQSRRSRSRRGITAASL